MWYDKGAAEADVQPLGGLYLLVGALAPVVGSIHGGRLSGQLSLMSSPVGGISWSHTFAGSEESGHGEWRPAERWNQWEWIWILGLLQMVNRLHKKKEYFGEKLRYKHHPSLLLSIVILSCAFQILLCAAKRCTYTDHSWVFTTDGLKEVNVSSVWLILFHTSWLLLARACPSEGWLVMA